MSQREVWLDHCAWPDSAHLNIGGGCFLVGRLDLAVFRRALRALVAEARPCAWCRCPTARSNWRRT